MTWAHDFDKDWSIKQIFYYNRYEGDIHSAKVVALDDFAFPYGPSERFPLSIAGPSMVAISGPAAYTQTLATEVNITGKINTWGVRIPSFSGATFTARPIGTTNHGADDSPESIFFPYSPGIPFIAPVSPC